MKLLQGRVQRIGQGEFLDISLGYKREVSLLPKK